MDIGKLSLGLVRMVEAARCLASGARFLLLDEPAAGLTAAEQARLAEQVRALDSSRLGPPISRLSGALMASLDDALRLHLAL